MFSTYKRRSLSLQDVFLNAFNGGCNIHCGGESNGENDLSQIEILGLVNYRAQHFFVQGVTNPQDTLHRGWKKSIGWVIEILPPL